MNVHDTAARLLKELIDSFLGEDVLYI